MLRLAFLCAALALLTTGCRSVWVHPEHEPKKFQADVHECQEAKNWKLCMMGRGWQTETGWHHDEMHRAPSGSSQQPSPKKPYARAGAKS